MIKQVSVALGVLAVAVGCSNQASDDSATTTTTTTTTTGSASAEGLTAQINTLDGRHVADANVDFTGGFATVTVETVEDGILSPGFHSMHIHGVGVCEAGDGFASAGEHFQAPGHTAMPASGDLPPLLVRSNGAGKLVVTSDAFTEEQLTTPQGSSIVLHESADVEGGDPAAAEQRIACGVLSPGTAGTAPVETQTTVVTTTAVAPPPPATVTETPAETTPPPAETPVTTTPPTATETVTETESPSPTTTTVAPPPGG
nr:superoxide dismutase family protein [Mycolicibacterium malmesburyense]CRL75895.1 Cu/Zn superoxide dismutase [Mycolicibacterium malmesburyense]